MKTTKETLNDLIIQHKSEMLVGDDLVQALEDFRDMWNGLGCVVVEISKHVEYWKDAHFKDDHARYEAYKDSLSIINEYLPNR